MVKKRYYYTYIALFVLSCGIAWYDSHASIVMGYILLGIDLFASLALIANIYRSDPEDRDAILTKALLLISFNCLNIIHIFSLKKFLQSTSIANSQLDLLIGLLSTLFLGLGVSIISNNIVRHN